jgi:hypothetical protein
MVLDGRHRSLGAIRLVEEWVVDGSASHTSCRRRDHPTEVAFWMRKMPEVAAKGSPPYIGVVSC